MKQTLALLVGLMICAATAQASDVKIKVVTSATTVDAPTKTFAADIPKIHAFIKTTGVQKGDKVRAVWIAEDVGDVAPANTKIEETAGTLDGDTDKADFSLSKPEKGWPIGKYRVEIYANDKLASTAKFTIGGGDEKAAESKTSAPDKTSGSLSGKSSDSEPGKMKFPAKNPAFEIEFPANWTCKADKGGNLDCKTGDDDAYVFSIIGLDAVHNIKELKAALPDLASSMAKGMKLKNFETGDIESDTNGNDVSFVGIAGEGAAEGIDFAVLVHGFEPQKGRFYAIVTAATKKGDAEHVKQYDEITASIMPVER